MKFCGDRISNFNGVVLSTQVCNSAIMLSVTNFIVMKIYNIGGDGHGTFDLYQNNYLIVFVFLCLGVLLPIVALTLGKLLRPNKPSDEKYTTYESGIDPFHDSRVQFNVRYYIFALMFVILM